MSDAFESFNQLDKKTEMILRGIGDDIRDYIHELGDNAWPDLCEVMINNLKKINFTELFKTFPAANNFHRLPLTYEKDQLSVVLFVFKPNEKEEGAMLVHVYSSEFPNNKVYHWNEVDAEVPQHGNTVMKTQPHSHSAKCYSVVAWVAAEVEVTEEIFKVSPNTHKLELIDQNPRHVHSCTYDSGKNGAIHSISVHFR